MSRRKVWFAAMLAVAGMICCSAANAWPLPRLFRKPVEVNWQTDLKAAQRTSRSTGKPMLIMFTATWCGPCQKLKKEVLSDAEVASRLNDDFVPVLLDIDREKRAAEVLEVENIPQIVVLSSEADEVGRTVGSVKKSDLIKEMNKSLAAAKELEPTSQVVRRR
jgi:protein disulfide-isomerase